MNEEPFNPYVNGKCWYGLKLYVKNMTIPCGLDARLYHVTRGNGKIVTMSMDVWVCINHKTSLERDGFTLTLVV